MNDMLIRQAFAGIGPPPGAEDRIRQRLETVLGEPLRARSVTVRPRVNPLPKLLAAAAMLTVVVGGTALILWPLLRPIFLPDGPELLTEIEEPADGTPAPTAAPTEEAEPVEEAPEEPEPAEPTEDPALVLGPIVDEGTVTLEDGRSLTWAVDQKGLLRIRGEGDMADFCGNYHWQTNWQDQLPWQGYLASVQTVVIEPGLTTIAPRAFSDFRSLTDLLLPDSLETIGDNAFYSCAKLRQVTIPDRVETIGDYAFCDCNALRQVQLPAGLRSIGTKAFYSCGLEELTIPGSVTAMGDFAFSYCNRLGSVTLEDGLETIGPYAFYCCDLLQTVTVPVSVKEIGRGAFDRWGKLTDLTICYAGSEEQWEQIKIANSSDSRVTAPTIRFDYEPEMPAVWPVKAPSYELSAIVAQDTITREDAAPGTSLSWALDDKGLLRIGGAGTMEDFYPYSYDSRNLHSYVLNVPWGRYAQSIHYAYIEPGTTWIGYGAFQGCASLTDVVIPEGVSVIRLNAFYNCYALESLTLPATVCRIDGAAFAGSGLKSLVIPDGVSTIESSTFADCWQLRSVEIPGSVTMICTYAFSGCRRLDDLRIPEGVCSIGERAFDGCTGLTSIRLPRSLTSIDRYAFAGCGGLTDVYYAGTEEEWKQIVIAYDNSCLLNATIHFGGEA